MKEHIKKLRQFHNNQQFALDLDLRDWAFNIEMSQYLRNQARNLLTVSEQMENMLVDESDPRLHQAHLLIEEMCESILGLANCNEEELFDGLCDLSFVTIGTAETFNLPISEGTMEVCDSNLTKKKRDPEVDPRCRDKGKDYRPPNLKAILGRSRNET